MRQSIGLALFVLCAFADAASAQLWWERGADKWYYKDDWKGQAVPGSSRGVVKTISGAKFSSGWIVVWGESGYRLLVNDKEIGASVDGGLIDDFDLTPFVRNQSKVTIRIEGGPVCAEGEVVDDGEAEGFATGPDWTDDRGGKVTAKPMTAGRSSGAFDRAHNGRLMSYNDEERGKTAIAKALARIQRLNEQGIYLMRRFRPIEDIISFDPKTPWRRAEAIAAPLVERAQTILKDTAIPAQKARKFADAIAAAKEAAILVSAAEAPIQSAMEMYQAQRRIMHVENIAAMLPLPLSHPLPGTPGRGQGEGPFPADIAEMKRMLAAARQAQGMEDWSGVHTTLARVDQQIAGCRQWLGAVGERNFGRLVGGIGELDEFPEDRFAWLNARELMGNEPMNWPFSIAPIFSGYIDLAGLWDFRIDPDNLGDKEGWATSMSNDGWMKLFAPKPWERQGITFDNEKAPNQPVSNERFKGRTGEDKPYNGYAWYRKRVVIPEWWKDKTLVLSCGKIQNWCRVYVNGKALEPVKQDAEQRRQAPGDKVIIAPALVQFGKENAIAINVYNHDNFGGIVSGPVALYVQGSEPLMHETAGPISTVQEWTFRTENRPRELVTISSAMSPAVLVATNDQSLHVHGWTAKGYEGPTSLQYVAGREMRTSPLGGMLPGISENWVVLRGARGDTLVVTSRKPRSVCPEVTAPEGPGFRINLDKPPMIAAIVHFPPEVKLDIDACRRWAKMLRKYPIAASEIVTELPKDGPSPQPSPNGRGSMQRHRIRYSYFDLDSLSTQNSPLPSAPLPMLASYALQYKYPGLKVEDITDTEYQSQYATYRVAENTDTITYTAPAVDRSKVMKGVGELFARKRASENIHGGLSETAMFKRFAEWGFDHCRYALAFDADWDLPMVLNRTKITDEPAIWRRLDELVANCNSAGVQMMLCWFPEIGSRRWKRNPEWEKTTLEWWRRVAERYKDLPEWAISYDPFNEPAYMNTDHWKQIMKELTASIRSVDKKHTIVWESADGWAQPQWCLWMEAVDDPNVIYSFHHYGKHWGYAYDEYYPGYQNTQERTQNDVWLEAILFGLRYHVPIHCGEFGISMIQPDGCGEAWLNDYLAFFERFGIGWNWWNYSGADIYRTGLAAGDRISPYVPILRKWAARSGWGQSRRDGR